MAAILFQYVDIDLTFPMDFPDSEHINNVLKYFAFMVIKTLPIDQLPFISAILVAILETDL